MRAPLPLHSFSSLEFTCTMSSTQARQTAAELWDYDTLSSKILNQKK